MSRLTRVILLLVVWSGLYCAGLAIAADEVKPGEPGTVLPFPVEPFGGKVGRTVQESTLVYPQPIKPPAGAPNVVIILLDDVGFGHASTFGGPIPTPAIEQLAHEGLRYNRFHTAAVCSPTRASLLSGRNPGRVATGHVMEGAVGTEARNTVWGADAASVAEVLRLRGFNTAAFGKWHNTPEWESGPSGPFDRWPTGKGFEYFFGFLGGDTNQFSPALYEGTTPIQAPSTPGYHFTHDMVEHAMTWVRNQHAADPSRPFFAYLAPGAAHAPLQAPKEWIDRFRGQFDMGWDRMRELTFERQKRLGVIPKDAKLTPRPPEVPAWSSFSKEEQKVFARMQEVYAGFLAHTDDEIGHFLEGLDELGVRDNTLVFYIVGDNGPSAEGSPVGSLNETLMINGIVPPPTKDVDLDVLGGPNTYGHYPTGWAWAGSTPFQYFKQVSSHLGAMRNPLIVSWPARIKDKGGLRSQFHHVNDVMPTILEATGIVAPRVVNGIGQKSIDGVSMVYSFDHPEAPSTHHTQYFEIFGRRSLYHDGWWAGADHGVMPWETYKYGTAGSDYAQDVWQLYNLDKDFSQSNDLSRKNPQKLKEMQTFFNQEAQRNHLYPLVDKVVLSDLGTRPSPVRGRDHFVFHPGMNRLRFEVAPNLLNKSYRISADVEVPSGPMAEGVLLANGGRFGGYALYVKQGRPVFIYNYLNIERTSIEATETLPVGKSEIRFEFVNDGGRPGAGGTGSLFINGKSVGSAHIGKTIPARVSADSGDAMDIGVDTGTPVSDAYQVPNRFNGMLKQVVVDLIRPSLPQ